MDNIDCFDKTICLQLNNAKLIPVAKTALGTKIHA